IMAERRWHMAATTIILDHGSNGVNEVRIPGSAHTLEGFRAWAKSGRFPDRGRISFIKGQVYVDMSPEELHKHNQPKTAIYATLFFLNQEIERGILYSDRALVTNKQAGLSTEPDGTFVSYHSLQRHLVRLAPRKDADHEFLEIVG